jgi:molybdate transport system ATP-binding protein
LSRPAENIEFNRACIRFNDSFSLLDIAWTLKPGQRWAIIGGNGSGKSALAASLAGAGEITSGSVNGIYPDVSLVSLEAQAELIERERLRDDSDLTDTVFEGTPVRELLAEVSPDQDQITKLISLFQLDSLLDRGFGKLSTGETRKVLMARAISSKPSMLVIDEPFEGLDAQTVPLVSEMLQQISATLPLVLVINRVAEIPDFITHVAFLEQGRLKFTFETSDEAAIQSLQQLFHLKTADIRIPPTEADQQVPALDSKQALVIIRNAHIRYSDNIVFEGVNWRIEPRQHWQLTGPNGSGKTCLLKLITGDHPQCYVNDIFVFGYQRGSGESIWDIKRHIGFVSSELQWSHRVSINCRNVIISGFYDSIGLYRKATDLQKDIAIQWLRVLALEERATQPFARLSYGDQRQILIARAMVKHPHLLILDEPCFGLDDINRQRVLALVEKICAGSETTVIYVNHHAQDRIDGIEHYLALA